MDPTADMSVEELKERNDSILQNISVLRFGIARIERLDALRVDFRSVLESCRKAAAADPALVARIDDLLKRSEE